MNLIVFFFLPQEFIPSELGGCCFPFCECQHLTTPHYSFLTFSSAHQLFVFIPFCLFTTCVLYILFIRIYFTNHTDATPRSFTAAVNPGWSTERLIMPLNEETFRIETTALPFSPKRLFSLSLTSRYHGETIPFQSA